MTKWFFKKFCQSGFCENTTLHGYNYLCFADSTIYKCIWFILILVMNGVAIYFFVKNTDAYINGGLQYEIETSTASLKVRPYCIFRVDMVGTNHNKVLTQWRHMPMGKCRAKFFLIRITSTYFWASEVFKNQYF